VLATDVSKTSKGTYGFVRFHSLRRMRGARSGAPPVAYIVFLAAVGSVPPGRDSGGLEVVNGNDIGLPRGWAPSRYSSQ
jgi:hypothetical protein